MPYSSIAVVNFNAADNTGWSTYRASNFTEYNALDPAYLKILNNRLVPAFGMLGQPIEIAEYTGSVSATRTADLGAKTVIRGLGSSDGRFFTGPAVRITAGTGSTANCYALQWYDGASSPQTIELVKYTNSVKSVLKTLTRVFVDGDELALKPVGQRLGIEVNDTEIDSFTDTGGFATGGAGFVFYGASTAAGPFLDNLDIGNISAAAATGVTATGPSSGTVGVASTNFSIGVTPVGGTITGTVVVTPSDGGGGGSFSPSTVSLSNGTPTGTCTYTPGSAGAKTISFTNDGGLANPSNIAFTANAGGDTTNPVLSGSITVSNNTTGTSYTLAWPAATDNVAVTGYEVSLNGGSSYTPVGNVLTTNITGRTPTSTDSVRVRAFDAAGNRSSALSASVTLPALPTYSMTIGPFALNTGSQPIKNAGVVYTLWAGVDTGAVSGAAINGSGTTDPTTGALTITGLAAPGSYLCSVKKPDGTGRWENLGTAA